MYIAKWIQWIINHDQKPLKHKLEQWVTMHMHAAFVSQHIHLHIRMYNTFTFRYLHAEIRIANCM